MDHGESSSSATDFDSGAPSAPQHERKDTNYFTSTLAKELTSHCLQYTTAHGDLSTGGLGVWSFLQYKLALNEDADEADPSQQATEGTRRLVDAQRKRYLQAARDACLDHLEASAAVKKVHPAGPQRIETNVNRPTSISIFTNSTIGVHAMLAVIYYQLGASVNRVSHHVELVLSEIRTGNQSLPSCDCDLMYGRAGALQAIFFLRQELQDSTLGSDEACAVARAILREGEFRAAKVQNLYPNMPLFWSWRTTPFLGAAHGIVGILYTLLGMDRIDLQNEKLIGISDGLLKIRRSINALSAHTFPSGNLRVVMEKATAAPQSSDHQVEWAHGAPGYIWLLLRAHEVFESTQPNASPYLRNAVELADTILWARRKSLLSTEESIATGKSGVGLSSGLAGVAYVFLKVHHATGDTMWKQRAEQLTRYIINHWKDTLHVSSRPYSILEGLGGIVALLLDLSNPTPQFPFFASQKVVSAPKNANRISLSSPPVKNSTGIRRSVSMENEKIVNNALNSTFLHSMDLDNEADEKKSPLPVMKSSQLQPAGLDKEKHEGMGEHRFLSRDSLRCEGTEQQSRSMDSTEFGLATDNDKPVDSFMRLSRDSFDESQRFVPAINVTPSQLQSMLPAGLDIGKHEDIREMMDSYSQIDTVDADDDEFGLADENDTPNQDFLAHQAIETSSQAPVRMAPSQLQAPTPSSLDRGIELETLLRRIEVMEDDLNQDDEDIIEGLDKEQHEDIGDLQLSRHAVDLNDDTDEFGATKETYDSRHSGRQSRSVVIDGDVVMENHESNNVEYENLKDSNTLDINRHEDLGDFTDSGHVAISDDEDEFELADIDDEPNSRYLQAQRSFQEEHFDDNSKHLDDEMHYDLGLFPEGYDSDENEEFVGAAMSDSPNRRFLEMQLSVHGDDIFVISEEDCSKTQESDRPSHTQLEPSGKKPTPVISRQAAFDRIPEILRYNSNRRKDAIARPIPQSRAMEDFKRYGRLFARECRGKSQGEGNLFDGGLGLCGYLNLRLCYFTQSRKQQRVSLKKAVASARASVQFALQNQSKKAHKPSLLAGEFVGSKCLLAEALCKLGKRKQAYMNVHDVISALELECSTGLSPSDCSLLYGKAGCLAAVHYLRETMNDSTIGHDFVLKTSAEILLEGRRHGSAKNKPILSWKWQGRELLGASTGLVGILQTLLCNSDAEWRQLEVSFPRAREVVKQSIDALEHLCHESGNLRASMDGMEGDNVMNWSHGSPGYIFLLLKAHDVFQEGQYLERARRHAEVVWDRRDKRKGVGLANGVSGIGYVFLTMARVDGENQLFWLRKAHKIALSSIRDIHKLLAPCEKPHSLFQGLGGLALFLLDLAHPFELPTPFLEICTPMRDKNFSVKEKTAATETGISKAKMKTPPRRKTCHDVSDPPGETGETVVTSGVQEGSPNEKYIHEHTNVQESDVESIASQLASDALGLNTTHDSLSDAELFELLGDSLPKFREGLGTLYTFVQRLESIAEQRRQDSLSRGSRRKPLRAPTPEDVPSRIESTEDRSTARPRMEPVSPLTNPVMTPDRSTITPTKLVYGHQNSASRLEKVEETPDASARQRHKTTPVAFPVQQKHYNYTTPERIPIAEKTTVSSRAKCARRKSNTTPNASVMTSTTANSTTHSNSAVQRLLGASSPPELRRMEFPTGFQEGHA